MVGTPMQEHLTGTTSPSSIFPDDGHYSQAPSRQVNGFYSNGSLAQPEVLSLEGIGFLKLHRWRNRAYGSLDLVEILERVAAEMVRLFKDGERLQVGDLSAEKGGLISGHASHQNGLDVDLIFLRVNRFEQDPEKTDGMPELFVVKGEVTPNFDTPRNWELIKTLVGSQRVGRIFVDQAIKDHLCSHALKTGEFQSHSETLRRLRPYPNHDNHLHLRITCPKNSPDCKEQEPPPVGSGC